MGLRSLFSRSSDLEPGDIIEVLDDSGDTVEATVATDDGAIDLGAQRTVVKYA